MSLPTHLWKWSLGLVILLTACGTAAPESALPPSTSPTRLPASPAREHTITPSLTSTPAATPTLTPVPAAIVVNGEGISQEAYQAELARFLAAQSTETDPQEAARRVQDELIDQLLLAQAAAKAGFLVTDEMVEARLSALEAQMGGRQALIEWQTANSYDETSFRQALARAIAAAWMRDQITQNVPQTAEQVRARQLLFYNSDQAQRVYDQLQSGVSFDTLLAIYDPLSQGELGWFPRGYLTLPEIEEVAFSLQPGEYSPVIKTTYGFHIIQVLERQADRPLDPEARLVLQSQALRSWLQQHRQQSEITLHLP